MTIPPDQARKTYRLSQAQRLSKRAEFDTVLKHADIRFTCYPVRLVAKQNNLEYARVGLNVAKRNVRSAVHRNRVKRLLREWFRLHQRYLASYDVVLSALEYSIDEVQLKAGIEALLPKWCRRMKIADS